jgi:hypothetical protein
MGEKITVEVELPEGLAEIVERRRSEVVVELKLPDRRRNLPTEESELSAEAVD